MSMRSWFIRFAAPVALTLGGAACRGPDAPAELPSPPPPVETESSPEQTEPADAAAPSESDSAAPGDVPPAATGTTETRTPEVIAQVIRTNREPFRACYEQGKKKIPELEGTLTLSFVLKPNGDVKTAELNRERSDIVEPVVVDCALSTLKAMKFPRSSRGMESSVNYPFDFRR